MATPTEELLRVTACEALDDAVLELRQLRGWLIPEPDPFNEGRIEPLDREQIALTLVEFDRHWERLRLHIEAAMTEARRAHLTGN